MRWLRYQFWQYDTRGEFGLEFMEVGGKVLHYRQLAQPVASVTGDIRVASHKAVGVWEPWDSAVPGHQIRHPVVFSRTYGRERFQTEIQRNRGISWV